MGRPASLSPHNLVDGHASVVQASKIFRLRNLGFSAKVIVPALEAR
jgi:hypothetical protein